MPLFETLIFGLCGFVLALLVGYFTKRMRALFSDIRLWFGSGAAGVIASLVSLVIQVDGFAGTGTRISKGWPKPYQFDWASFDKTEAGSSFNELYFAGNCFFYVGFFFLLATVFLSLRALTNKRVAA